MPDKAPKDIFPLWPEAIITLRISDGTGDNTIYHERVSGAQELLQGPVPKNEWVGLNGGLDELPDFRTYRYLSDIGDDAATSYMVLGEFRNDRVIYPNEVLVKFGQWGHRIPFKIHLRAITLRQTVTAIDPDTGAISYSYTITDNTTSTVTLPITDLETASISLPVGTVPIEEVGSSGDTHMLFWEAIEIPILS